MFSHVSVHPSFCLSTGGYPSQVQLGATPAGVVPHLGYPPPLDLTVGYFARSITLLGGTPPQVPPPIRPGWGYPAGGNPTLGTPIRHGWGVTPARGIPCHQVPHLGYPPSDLAGGGTLPGSTPPWVPPSDPARGTPPQVPPSDLAGGYPAGGTPPWVPPVRPGQGYPARGYPCWRSTPPRETDGVLDMPRSVCLLRSHRRTFLSGFFSHEGGALLQTRGRTG